MISRSAGQAVCVQGWTVKLNVIIILKICG